jgi:putative ABC transport system permease protein
MTNEKRGLKSTYFLKSKIRRLYHGEIENNKNYDKGAKYFIYLAETLEMLMWFALKQIYESLLFALGALKENLLRTILSLLGVTVGIFAIIGVLTLVDTLNDSIKNSLSFIGNKVIYVDVFPWTFGKGEYPWWKYIKRPNPTYEEYKVLEKNLTQASAVSVFAVRGGLNVKYKNSSAKGIVMQGISYAHNKVADLRIEEGRYFTEQETESGRNVILIGATLAKDLFGSVNPIGETIKINNIPFNVIAVLKKQGDNLLGAPSTDNICIAPFKSMQKMFISTRRKGVRPQIALKGFESDTGLQELEYEAKGVLRAYRGLKPLEEDNFALNRPEALFDFIDGIIVTLKIGGWLIGSFSMLVGCFGIANIMFVSVKERTNLIGIQKSLGAKNYFILFQFLFEAIFLSVIGGLAGLLLVSMLSFLSTDTFVIKLTTLNIIIGLGVSSIIGVLAGIIPAISASRLDPVIAIRSK